MNPELRVTRASVPDRERNVLHIAANPGWALGAALQQRAGLTLEPDILLGICGGAGLAGDPEAEPGGASPLLTGWDPAQSSLATGAVHLGAFGALHETARPGRAAEQLAAALAGDDVVIAWLRPTALPEPLDHRGLVPAVLQAAADGSGYQATLGPQLTLTLSDEQFTAARGAKGTAHRLLTVAAPTVELPRAVRGGLAAAAVGGKRSRKRPNGPAGAQALAHRISGDGRRDWRRRFGDRSKLSNALHGLADVITAECGLLRRSQASFVRRAAQLLEIDALHEVADRQQTLAADWEAIAQQANALTAAPSTRGLADLAAAVSTVSTAEADALELLRATLRAH